MKNIYSLKNVSTALFVALSVTAVVFFIAPVLTGTIDKAEACCGTDTSTGGDVVVISGGGGGGSSVTPPTCDITASLEYAKDGQSYTINWKVVSATAVNAYINGDHVKKTGSATYTFDAKYDKDVFKLTAENAGGTCSDKVTILRKEVVAAPKCVSFAANPTVLPAGGGSTKITWETKNADHVQIVNLNTSVRTDVGNNNTSGRNFNVSEDTTFRLVVYGADGSKDNSCEATVKVKAEQKVASCDWFTADPTSLPYGGGQVKLSWATTNADTVSINNGVGTVAADGSKTVNVSNDTTYTLTAKGANNNDTCTVKINVKDYTPEPKAPSCDWFNADPTYLPYGGGQVNLSWATTNANSVYINNGVGNVAVDGSKTVNVTDDTTFTLTATGTDGKDSCTVNVKVKDWNPEPKECEMQITKSVDKTDAKPGDHLTYTIKVKNIGTGDCTGGGVKIFDYVDGNLSFVSQTHTSNLSAGYYGDVYDSSKHLLTWNGHTLNPGESGTISWTGKVKTPNQCGDYKVYNTAKVTAQELNNFGTWISSNKVQTSIDYDCEQKTASCDWFTVSPTSLPYGGGDVTLSWATTNAQSVSINNGVGTVAADGSETVYVSDDTTFTLTVTGVNNDDTCTASVDVKPQHKVASCDDFYITPATLSKAGDVTLHWATTNAESVYINNGVGNVSADGTETVYVSDDTTFTLTVDGVNNDDTCTAKVRVEEEEEELTCDDVDFTVSDSKVKKGADVTLYWNVSNEVDDVSIDNGIGDVARNGQETVEINSDTTFHITIENEYSSRTCSVDVDIQSSGGGSSSPSCDLDISDFKIEKGENITLEWKTTRATDVKIKDNHGNVLLDTDDMLSDEKKDFLDGEMSLKPSEDTEYTLIASRGSKDRTCRETVKVDDDDDVVVYEVRDQQPLVAGVYLTQVPYTGFEAGPALTTLFYGLLTLWALFVAYVLVIRRDSILGFSLPFARSNAIEFDEAAEDEFRKKVQMLAAKHSHNPWNNLR